MTEQVLQKDYRKLESSKYLKRLMTRYFMTLRYFKWNRPVAWVTSGAPVELIRACGFLVAYPENYGAICGASKVGEKLCNIAEEHGFSIDTCSYARANIGAMVKPDEAPLGGLPKPNCLVAASNLCNTLVKWFEVAADYFNVPLFVIDVPFQFHGKELPHDNAYIMAQFHTLVENLQRISGKRFTLKKYRKVLRHSMEAITLWKQIRETGIHHPSPINAPDLFLTLAPIVSLRGTRGAVRFYQRMYAELQRRIERGLGAIKEEKIRLLWDNIAIWFNLFDFFRFFSKRNACFVVSTYTDAWSGSWSEDEDPFEATARLYKKAYLNLSLDTRAEMMIQSVNKYAVNGIVMHSDRSCKPYSLGQSEILNKVTDATGIPGILIDADMVDPRFYTDAQVKNRLEAFLEMVQEQL